MFDSIETNEIVKDIYASLKQKSSILFEVTQDLVLPSFSNSIPTACVSFVWDNEDINASFEFNPDFWVKLNVNEKFFVFVHEVLHVLFFHGSRGKSFMESIPEDQRDRKLLNVAMDICINELIVREYMDVPLSSLPELKDNMCNIVNCFPDTHDTILKGKSFDYYYMELLKNHPGNMDSFDMHGFMDEDLAEEDLEKIQKAIQESLSGKEKEDLENDQIPKEDSKSYSEGGTASGSNDFKLETPKQKLEHHLDLFIASKFGGREPMPKYKNVWHKTNRRMHGVSHSKDMHLPHKEELPVKKGKHKIVVYADVSGSVASYSRMFMNLIGGLSESKFEIDIYAFGSYVVPAIRKDGRITYRGAGGGTNIRDVLDHYKRNYTKKDRPDATLVLTDGYYSNIRNHKEDYFSDWVFFLINKNENRPAASKSVFLSI